MSAPAKARLTNLVPRPLSIVGADLDDVIGLWQLHLAALFARADLIESRSVLSRALNELRHDRLVIAIVQATDISVDSLEAQAGLLLVARTRLPGETVELLRGLGCELLRWDEAETVATLLHIGAPSRDAGGRS